MAWASRQTPLFLVLDDLQWADESTLALLHYLATRVGPMPVVIVETYRDSTLDTNPALVRTLEELLRIGLRPLKLEGLSHEAVGQRFCRKVVSNTLLPTICGIFYVPSFQYVV